MTVVVVLALPEYAVTGGGVLFNVLVEGSHDLASRAYMVLVAVAFSVSISVLVGAVTVVYDDTT